MTKPLTADFLTDRTQYVSVGGECSEDEDEEYKKKEIMVPVTTF